MAQIPKSKTNSSLLLASVPSLSPPSFRSLAPAIAHATRSTSNRLIIVLVSNAFASDDDLDDYAGEDIDGNSSANANDAFGSYAQQHQHLRRHKGQGQTEPIRWHAIQRLLTFVYVQAAKIANEEDNILLHVDVLLKSPEALASWRLDSNKDLKIDVVYRIQGNGTNLRLPPSLSSLPQNTLQHPQPDLSTKQDQHPNQQHQVGEVEEEKEDEGDIVPLRFPVIALGGTFDHLHAGHKILLSMAAWIASRKLIVGVTDTSLLSSKKNGDLLESLETRISNTKGFLILFKPSLVYDVVPIHDVYGPTGYDPDIQALVVSKETISGANSIAAHRLSHGLPALQTFVISVISHEDEDINEDDMTALRTVKMSSTAIREWIAKKVQEGRDVS